MADIPLFVFAGRRRVGMLTREPLRFTYAPTWLSAAEAFPLSVALPLSPQPFGEEPVRAFFFNLLPEGNVRRRLAGRLGISAGNDYALLAEIGGECAGAISVLKTAEPGELEGDYVALADDEIAERIATGAALGSFAGTSGVRLSLAGAQDKLPVFIDDVGRIFLPRGAVASSHILKFANGDFKQLPANEALVLRIAAGVGLSTVASTLRRFGRAEALVVERYDRARGHAGVERWHQEDFCQALGLPAERKYEAEGGPSFRQCIDLVSEHSADPLRDRDAAIRWQIFNAAVGNSDGHAKNLALLEPPRVCRRPPDLRERFGNGAERQVPG